MKLAEFQTYQDMQLLIPCKYNTEIIVHSTSVLNANKHAGKKKFSENGLLFHFSQALIPLIWDHKKWIS
jgi:hypothetical protein